MKNTASLVVAAFLGAILSGWLRSPEIATAHTADGARANEDGRPYLMGTGGASDNKNDLCWVLTKIRTGKGQERLMLSLYQAKENGKHFDLQDTRWIDPDLRMPWNPGKKQDPSVREVFKNLPKEDQMELKEPPEDSK